MVRSRQELLNIKYLFMYLFILLSSYLCIYLSKILCGGIHLCEFISNKVIVQGYNLMYCR